MDSTLLLAPLLIFLLFSLAEEVLKALDEAWLEVKSIAANYYA
jgi:hypothetical protein